ncbi:MAG: HAMP domain-containing sensor histidine kinase [Lachnospiraceae bacterium]|nr:HAMP domain-containing sensor histidine kinase [Lachnospiraceae bacterium]
MKLNITKRLVLYFASILLLFAVIVGTLFSSMFYRQSVQIHKDDLAKRATTIANTLADYMQTKKEANGYGQGGGYGAYLKLIDDIAMSEVWIVDQKAETVDVGTGKNKVSYTELPEEELTLVAEVFNGKVAFNDGPSNLVEDPWVSVGAPVYNSNRNVTAAVILRTHLSDIDSSVKCGYHILCVSILIALFMGIIVAVVISRNFTKPLKNMQKTTQQLINGVYTAETGVVQNDEIGFLAGNIDILAHRLQLAKEESESLEQMRKDYISNISHELRTPVTVIRGSLEALCDGIISHPEKVKEYHEEMLLESIHLERMVNDLLELSRLQNTDYAIEKTSVNLLDVLSDAVRSARHIAIQKQIEISYVNNGVVRIIEGDNGRLRQMFLTVLDNAIKFSDYGQKIEVEARQVDREIVITVCDYGVGISTKDLPFIFDRFYKCSDEKNLAGTGLGLAIAKEISKRHAIEISATSILDEKTVFTFKCTM